MSGRGVATASPLSVRSSSGALVQLTREQCDARMLDGTRCRGRELRAGTGPLLCWVHRKAAERRVLSMHWEPVELDEQLEQLEPEGAA